MLSIGNNKLYIQNISNRYNHEIRNIMYANLRSIIAYRPINQMNDQFIQQNLHKYIQNDKFNNFMDIRFDPLFYNGPHIRKNRNDVQGYILYANKSLYITFRGSNDTDDLMACIDIRRKHLGNDIYIHKGYYDQFMYIESNITADIVRFCNSHQVDNLIFSGHSMGGAIAMIASPYYSTLFNGNKIVSCYTFGTTMVGNENFVKWFTDNVKYNYRIQAKLDPIPLIPIHESYIHVPNNITISEEYFTNYDEYNKNSIIFCKNILHNKELLTKLVYNHNSDRYFNIIYNAYEISLLNNY